MTLPNPKYKPDCPECPEALRAAECAENTTGLIVDADGFIDLDAMGAPTGGFFLWDSNNPQPLPGWMQAVIDYYKCLGRNVDLPGILANAQIVNPNYDGVGVGIGGDGRLTLAPRVIAPQEISSCDVWSWVFTAPGINYTGPGGPPPCGGAAHTAIPIREYEDAVNCETAELPIACLRTITVTPSQGGPCVDLVLDSDGQIGHAEVDGVTVDLASWTSMEGVSFRFGPCTAVAEEQCAPVLPDDAALDIDLTNLTASGNNFVITAGWPFDTDASQYTIATVDGEDNTDGTYTTEGSPITVPADSPVVCEPPCGPGFVRRAPEILDDQCWECLDDERNILVYKVDGMDPNVTYQPLLTVTGGSDSLDQVQAFMSATPAGYMAPQDSLAGYVCGLTQLPPIEAFRIQPGEQLVVDGCSVSFKCAGRSFDGFADRYVNAGDRPWVDPWICGDCAWLVLAYPCEHEAPDVVFAVEPVSER